MFRFTIRDVLWLTVVVAMGVALGIEHRRFTAVQIALQEQQANLNEAQAKTRFAELRAKELRGGVILTPSPQPLIRLPEASERAKDE
jgi:hypothetical protein